MWAGWQQWCRLCGKTDCNEAWIDVASIENLSLVIEKHFAISVSSRCLNLYTERILNRGECQGVTFYSLFMRFQFSESNDLHTNLL